jgi:SEC-C motif-containing protein
VLAPDALALMRSRYSAYELNLPEYIMDTTHPEHPEYTVDRTRWKGDLETFSKHTSFDRLKILEFTDGEETATVSFTAYLRQADKDASFTEKSTFAKVDGKWFYKSGEVT